MVEGRGCSTTSFADFADGIERRRILYGDEASDWGANTQPCHDCNVTKGQFHHPGCDVERCPRCERQVISCGCIGRE
jgi:hypothetical protein